MVNLRDLWENKKPAAEDTAAAGEETTANQADEETIEFNFGSDDEAKERARQLTTDKLGGGYEMVETTAPAAAAASAALAATIITQTQTAPPLPTTPRGLLFSPTTATAPHTTRGSATPAPQQNRSLAADTDSALLTAVAQQWESIKGDQAAVLHEFMWQQDIENNTAKGEAFKLDALQVTPRLRLFALMQENLAYIQLVFGVTTYNDVMGPAAFKGKVFGFVGDRSADSSPEVIVLNQPDNTWKWKKCKVVFEETAFVTHYSVEANRESLWHQMQPFKKRRNGSRE